MTTIRNSLVDDPTGTLDEQFVELVCSDNELLRAEFEAIVAAEWPTPPPPCPPLRRPALRPPAPSAHWLEGDSTHLASRPRRPGVGGWARQRSPPQRAAPPLGRV